MGLDRHFWQLLRNRTMDRLRITGVARTLTVAITELMRDSADKVTFCSGITLPTVASTGYAKGCLFIKTDAGTGLPGLYTNIGTSTSCNFVALGQLNTTIVDITNAQIKALRATPKLLVAAPGAGYYLEFVSARLFLDYGTNVLTESADNLIVVYTGTTGTIASEVIECTGFIDAGADAYAAAVPCTSQLAATTAALENTGLYLFNNGDGEFAGNAGLDTVMQVRTNYRVWPALT